MRDDGGKKRREETGPASQRAEKVIMKGGRKMMNRRGEMKGTAHPSPTHQSHSGEKRREEGKKLSGL